MQFGRIESTYLFFYLFHTAVVLYCVLVCGYLFMITAVNQDIQSTQVTLAETQEILNVVSTQNNYLQSETYAIRYIKEVLDRRLLGEKVIDTSSWEKGGVIESYAVQVEERNVHESWLDCLFGNGSCMR